MTRIFFFSCIGSYDQCANSLQIYLFHVKRQAKNDFLKDVESTVGGCFGLFISS